jgi:galactitol-specific phosphotransferase system IIC component
LFLGRQLTVKIEIWSFWTTNMIVFVHIWSYSRSNTSTLLKAQCFVAIVITSKNLIKRLFPGCVSCQCDSCHTCHPWSILFLLPTLLSDQKLSELITLTPSWFSLFSFI